MEYILYDTKFQELFPRPDQTIIFIQIWVSMIQTRYLKNVDPSALEIIALFHLFIMREEVYDPPDLGKTFNTFLPGTYHPREAVDLQLDFLEATMQFDWPTVSDMLSV